VNEVAHGAAAAAVAAVVVGLQRRVSRWLCVVAADACALW